MPTIIAVILENACEVPPIKDTFCYLYSLHIFCLEILTCGPKTAHLTILSQMEANIYGAV